MRNSKISTKEEQSKEIRSIYDLVIQKSEKIGIIQTVNIKGNKEYLLNGNLIDRFELLSIACEQDDEENAWNIMNLASILFHPLDDHVFNSLYGVVAMEITRSFIRNEFYYQKLFKSNYQKIRNGKIVNIKTDGDNIPDAWVKLSNEIIPVEVKLKKFDKKALKQLKRYMRVYGCNKGIAVSDTLTVELPKNIEFISFLELKSADK